MAPRPPPLLLPLLATVAVVVGMERASADANSLNLSCYQCQRSSDAQCGPESLLPCDPQQDRCVTHIAKDAISGYSLKRECGLGPCSFEDDMVNKGLGMARACDTSKDTFFCVSCCRTSGCNRGFAASPPPTCALLALASAASRLLCMH